MNQSNASITRVVSDHHYAHSRVAFIQACWHQDIVDQGRQSFIETIGKSGVSATQIELHQVPGSLEIPLHAKLLANSGRFDIIVAAGLITDGGIYRHEFVAQAVIDGLMRVQLDSEIPVLSMVLTPHHFHDSGEHHAFFLHHFSVKGAELAAACLQTLGNMRTLALAKDTGTYQRVSGQGQDMPA